MYISNKFIIKIFTLSGSIQIFVPAQRIWSAIGHGVGVVVDIIVVVGNSENA